MKLFNGIKQYCIFRNNSLKLLKPMILENTLKQLVEEQRARLEALNARMKRELIPHLHV